MPDSADRYFESFSAYLRSGDASPLSDVFPQAEDLSYAAVYRNGYINSSIEALRASYPVVDKLVGGDYFSFLASAYIEKHPPTHSSFTRYGDQFPGFLHAQRAQHQLNYLADFARLDQAWLSAFFAADSILLSTDDVEHWQQQGRDISELSVCLPKASQILSLDYQLSSLWSALKTDSSPDDFLSIEPGLEIILVWRDAQQAVNVRVLNSAELAFVEPLISGGRLLEAATLAVESSAEFPVLDFFSELLELDLLALK